MHLAGLVPRYAHLKYKFILYQFAGNANKRFISQT